MSTKYPNIDMMMTGIMETMDPRMNTFKEELDSFTKKQLTVICLNFRVHPSSDRSLAIANILQSPLPISEKLTRVAKIRRGWVISTTLRAENAAPNMAKHQVTVQAKPKDVVLTKTINLEEKFEKEIAKLNMEQLLAICRARGFGLQNCKDRPDLVRVIKNDKLNIETKWSILSNVLKENGIAAPKLRQPPTQPFVYQGTSVAYQPAAQPVVYQQPTYQQYPVFYQQPAMVYEQYPVTFQQPPGVYQQPTQFQTVVPTNHYEQPIVQQQLKHPKDANTQVFVYKGLGQEMKELLWTPRF